MPSRKAPKYYARENAESQQFSVACARVIVFVFPFYSPPKGTAIFLETLVMTRMHTFQSSSFWELFFPPNCCRETFGGQPILPELSSARIANLLHGSSRPTLRDIFPSPPLPEHHPGPTHISAFHVQSQQVWSPPHRTAAVCCSLTEVIPQKLSSGPFCGVRHSTGSAVLGNNVCRTVNLVTQPVAEAGPLFSPVPRPRREEVSHLSASPGSFL